MRMPHREHGGRTGTERGAEGRKREKCVGEVVLVVGDGGLCLQKNEAVAQHGW